MRCLIFCCTILLAASVAGWTQQAAAAKGYTLTIFVEGVNSDGGNVGVLVFNSSRGWAEDRTAALKDITVPAHPGTVTITVAHLPAGEYAVAVVHDVNRNHKLDRNFVGKPKEQWGLSNNPHAVIKTPSYSSCTFALQGDKEIHVTM